jgi:hypothetical protein
MSKRVRSSIGEPMECSGEKGRLTLQEVGKIMCEGRE